MTAHIEKLLKDAILNDYYTAAIKSEVTLDTLLTPVIAEMLSIGLGMELKYITKEFPLLKDNKIDRRSCKADYMLSDKDNIWLVELKTTSSSSKDSQYKNYKNIEGTIFTETLGRDFLSLLYETYNIPKNENGFHENLRLFSEKTLGDIPESEAGLEILRSRMKKEKLTGTRKYIMQAFQMLISNEDFSDNKKVKVLYLVPHRKVHFDLQQLTFAELIRKCDRSCSEYLRWLITNILSPLFT